MTNLTFTFAEHDLARLRAREHICFLSDQILSAAVTKESVSLKKVEECAKISKTNDERYNDLLATIIKKEINKAGLKGFVHVPEVNLTMGMVSVWVGTAQEYVEESDDESEDIF